MPLSNRAPVNAVGQLMVTTTAPTAMAVAGGMTAPPNDRQLCDRCRAPASEPWTVAYGCNPVMYVMPPAGASVHVGGIAVSADGRVYMTVAPPTLVVVGGRWPVTAVSRASVTPPVLPTVVTTAATSITAPVPPSTAR